MIGGEGRRIGPFRSAVPARLPESCVLNSTAFPPVLPAVRPTGPCRLASRSSRGDCFRMLSRARPLAIPAVRQLGDGSV
jgi:hypothetical protein